MFDFSNGGFNSFSGEEASKLNVLCVVITVRIRTEFTHVLGKCLETEDCCIIIYSYNIILLHSFAFCFLCVGFVFITYFFTLEDRTPHKRRNKKYQVKRHSGIAVWRAQSKSMVRSWWSRTCEVRGLTFDRSSLGALYSKSNIGTCHVSRQKSIITIILPDQ